LSVPPAASAAAWNASTVGRKRAPERDVDVLGHRRPRGLEPEARLPPELRLLDKPGGAALQLDAQLVAEGSEGLDVEGLAALVIGDVDADVVDHRRSLIGVGARKLD